jgi:hypothetical protein
MGFRWDLFNLQKSLVLSDLADFASNNNPHSLSRERETNIAGIQKGTYLGFKSQKN